MGFIFCVGFFFCLLVLMFCLFSVFLCVSGAYVIVVAICGFGLVWFLIMRELIVLDWNWRNVTDREDFS